MSATYTAKQIADALGIDRRTARDYLGEVEPLIKDGQKAQRWAIPDFPATLLNRLDAEAQRQRCKGIMAAQRVEILLSMPRQQLPPPLPLEQICEADIKRALELREIFQPFLERQHDPGMTATEFDAAGVEAYRRATRIKISASYFRKLFNRFVERDNGVCNWGELSIYLPPRPHPKELAADPAPAELGNKFADIEHHIANNLGNPVSPDKAAKKSLWGIVLKKYERMLAAGEPEAEAKYSLIHFLSARAKFLAASPEALRKSFEYRLTHGVSDGRKKNGRKPTYPQSDLELLRHFASEDHEGCIDEAWRNHYRGLTKETRDRHHFGWKCPKRLRKAVNRIIVDALTDLKISEKRFKDKAGLHLTLDHAGLYAMDEWIFDDLTADVQVEFTDNEGVDYLLRPQIIAGLDRASRCIVCFAMSNDKGPTSRLVCAAVKHGLSVSGVPNKIVLENGWVFGGAKNINGRENEDGETIVQGLGSYGCQVYHHKPSNSTSKSDLENAFNAIQRRMKCLPGYTGNCERSSASDSFKREQRLIENGLADAKDYRFTFEEFVKKLLEIIHEYNSTPQPYGRLRSLSPREAFEKLANPVPVTKFSNELRWLLDEKYRVTVGAGGVRFTHYGKLLEVRGGELPKHLGEDLWALVDRNDDSMVTFMSLDYTATFTVEVCREPSVDESRIATGSGILAAEQQKIGAHVRHVKEEIKRLRGEFGTTRQNLLAEMRQRSEPAPEGETERRILVDPQMAEAGELMRQQRQAILVEREHAAQQRRQVDRLAQSTGVYATAGGLAKLTPEQIQILKNIKAPKTP